MTTFRSARQGDRLFAVLVVALFFGTSHAFQSYHRVISPVTPFAPTISSFRSLDQQPPTSRISQTWLHAVQSEGDDKVSTSAAARILDSSSVLFSRKILHVIYQSAPTRAGDNNNETSATNLLPSPNVSCKKLQHGEGPRGEAFWPLPLYHFLFFLRHNSN